MVVETIPTRWRSIPIYGLQIHCTSTIPLSTSNQRQLCQCRPNTGWWELVSQMWLPLSFVETCNLLLYVTAVTSEYTCSHKKNTMHIGNDANGPQKPSVLLAPDRCALLAHKIDRTGTSCNKGNKNFRYTCKKKTMPTKKKRLASGTAKRQRQIQGKQGNDEGKQRASPGSVPTAYSSWLGCGALILLGWVLQFVDLTDIPSWWGSTPSIKFGQSFDDPWESLIRDFPVGGKVFVGKSSREGSGFGTFARTDIAKGEIVMQISRTDRISSDDVATPLLRAKINEILEQINGPVPTANLILTVVAFLLELHKGPSSRFYSYIATLPRDINQTAWHWSPSELECVVPRSTRMNPERQQATLRNFEAAMKQLTTIPPLNFLPSDILKDAAWGYLLVETRGFDTVEGVSLQPILDHANHDPTKAVSPFSMKTGTDYLVATHDIKKGEEVYNSYGPLSGLETAEHYGFLDPRTPYVAAPSLSMDLQASALTKDVLPCQRTMTFFGNISSTVTSQASFQHLKQFVQFKAFRPSKLTYECLRVLLQSEDGPTLAKYVAHRVRSDIEAYETMASAFHCQGDSGNFELIRRSNKQTATLLRGVLEEAQRASLGSIDYLDVAYQ